MYDGRCIYVCVFVHGMCRASDSSGGIGTWDATEVSSDDWNHPLCWSEPSRYTSQGYRKPSLSLDLAWATPAQLVPLSNHTSIVSEPWNKHKSKAQTMTSTNKGKRQGRG